MLDRMGHRLGGSAPRNPAGPRLSMPLSGVASFDRANADHRAIHSLPACRGHPSERAVYGLDLVKRIQAGRT